MDLASESMKSDRAPVLRLEGDKTVLKGNGTLILDSTAVQTTDYGRSAYSSLYMRRENALDNALEMRGGHNAGELYKLVLNYGYLMISGFETAMPPFLESGGWEGWAQYIEISPKENDTPPAPLLLRQLAQ